MKRRKVKEILLFLIVCLSVFSLVGCAEKNENDQFIYYVNENITFVEVVGFSGNNLKQPYRVFVHKETKVMYISYRNGHQGGISVMLDENGKLPRIKGALMADAVATTAGAVLGTSTTTTFVESASGVTEGGRTGLTAIVTGLLFLLSVIFSPLFLTIPSFATAPALIIVGFYMMASVLKIDWENALEAIPAFLCILCMPLMYSISEGIAVGVISWVLLHVCTGNAKKEKVSVLMYILAVLFVLKYIFL